YRARHGGAGWRLDGRFQPPRIWPPDHVGGNYCTRHPARSVDDTSSGGGSAGAQSDSICAAAPGHSGHHPHARWQDVSKETSRDGTIGSGEGGSMSFLFSRLGRYIVGRVAGGVLIALLAVLACILLIDLVEQMRTVGSRTDISLLEALRLTLLKTPMLVEQTLPFVVLAGTMGAIIALNRSSELVAMRAAGVSAWRFLTPSAFVGVVLGVVAITTLNPLGAYLYQQFEAEKEDALSERLTTAGENGVWIRQGNEQGQVVIHA